MALKERRSQTLAIASTTAVPVRETVKRNASSINQPLLVSKGEELGSGSDCYSDDFDDVSSSDASSVDAGASRRVRSRKSSRRSRKSSSAYVSAVGGKRSGESLSPPLEIEDDYAEDFESDDSDDDVRNLSKPLLLLQSE